MFELNENKKHQNLWDTSTTRIREKYITLKAYFTWFPEVGSGWEMRERNSKGINF